MAQSHTVFQRTACVHVWNGCFNLGFEAATDQTPPDMCGMGTVSHNAVSFLPIGMGRSISVPVTTGSDSNDNEHSATNSRQRHLQHAHMHVQQHTIYTMHEYIPKAVQMQDVFFYILHTVTGAAHTQTHTHTCQIYSKCIEKHTNSIPNLCPIYAT